MSELEGGWAAWEAKRAIADAVVPILKSYRELFLLGKSQCVPNWVVREGEALNEAEMIKRWISHLNAMIASFELELSGHVLTEDEYSKQDIGLQLFAQYFGHLWD